MWGGAKVSTYIYIPKPYEILGDSELTETLASPLTYKSAQVDGQKTTDASGFLCAYGIGDNLLAGAYSSTIKDRLNAWVSDGESSSATLNGRIIHFAPCERHEFDGLANEAWTPAELNHDVTYHNNMSESGEFIGRNVVRRGRSTAIEPLSVYAPPERLQELYDIARAMEQTPVYVRVLAPHSVYVYFGWVDNIEVQHLPNPDFGYCSLSFELRATA